MDWTAHTCCSVFECNSTTLTDNSGKRGGELEVLEGEPFYTKDSNLEKKKKEKALLLIIRCCQLTNLYVSLCSKHLRSMTSLRLFDQMKYTGYSIPENEWRFQWGPAQFQLLFYQPPSSIPLSCSLCHTMLCPNSETLGCWWLNKGKQLSQGFQSESLVLKATHGLYLQMLWFTSTHSARILMCV